MIKEWEGKSGKTTEPFRIKGKMWRIRWKSKQDMFTIATPVMVAPAGKDVSYVYKSGTFYLTVTATGEWSIKIEEQKINSLDDVSTFWEVRGSNNLLTPYNVFLFPQRSKIKMEYKDFLLRCSLPYSAVFYILDLKRIY